MRDGDPPVAERFELYLGPLELANGYHELTDADEQRRRFERDLAIRAGRRVATPAVDERLLDALAHGLPDCAGVALGVDRLLMAMLGTLGDRRGAGVRIRAGLNGGQGRVDDVPDLALTFTRAL